MRRYLAVAAAAALVGAFAFPAPGLAQGERIEICHRSALGPSDGPAWRLLSVGGRAAEFHVDHGDGVPGGPVPRMAGQTFDASCTPGVDTGATTTTTLGGTPTACLDGAFGNPDLGVTAVNVEDGAAWWDSTDGTCTGDIWFRLTIVDGAADRAEAQVACASLLGGLPDQYYPLNLEWLYPGALVTNWWACP